MKSKYKITIYVGAIVILVVAIISLSFRDVSIEQKIKDYYQIIDASRNVNRYNSLVTKDRHVNDLTGIPNIVEKRDLIEIKQIDVSEYKELISYIESKEPKKNIKFYMVKYNITFKRESNSPVDSGIYYQIVVFEKENGKWLLNGDTFNGSYSDGRLSIDN